MIKTEKAEAILKLLQTELAAVNNLEEALNKEKLALEQLDSSEVEACAKEKINIFFEIEDLEKNRYLLLEELGLNHDRAGMKKFIDTVPNQIKSKIKSNWDKILQTLESCKFLNLANGNIINNDHKRVQKILTLLFGNNDCDLYGSKAQTLSSRTKHTINKA